MSIDTDFLKKIKQRYRVIGNDDALNRALHLSAKVAPVDISVLILGENGTGKEILPRIIHDISKRSGHKFLSVSCGAIPEGTIDSELFGHVKGAFTGSIESREGYFAAADKGTLFLDEIGELPLQTQVRLLRVLETGEYIPVGSSEVRKTNVRIIAATNADLPRLVREGKFREDLYYRIAAAIITLPPLRARGKDIDLLFRYFATEVSQQYAVPTLRLSPEAQQQILHYSWPGNIRQMRHLVETMSITTDERPITAETLNSFLPTDSTHTQLVAAHTASPATTAGLNAQYESEREMLFRALYELRHDVDELKTQVAALQGKGKANLPMGGYTAPNMPDMDYAEEVSEKPTATSKTLNDVERQLITDTLRQCGGKRKAAAAQMGMSERTLYRKIKEYGLE